MKRIGRWWIVPANRGAPVDLPPWARDEIVHGRVLIHDLEAENRRLRLDHAVANGTPPAVAMREEHRRALRCAEILREETT